MDNTNLEILQQLQAYAMDYFNAIVELNSVNGECSIVKGKYTANNMITIIRDCAIPLDAKFDEKITVHSGSFRTSFPYRQIFSYLNSWESMCKAGKLKAVFEVGDVETITAKVLTSEKSTIGTYKEKRMKLQRVTGNWFVSPKRKKNEFQVMVYYKTESLVIEAGKCGLSMVENPERYKDNFDKVEKSLFKSILKFAKEGNEYLTEVAKRLDLHEQKDYTLLISSICKAAGNMITLGYLLEICRKGCEIEELANNIGIEPTKEETTEPKKEVKIIPKDPPGPPKAICEISGPPGFKFIIKPTINKNLILQNHDRNNCLAPPHHHNRGLRLPRLPGGSGNNLRHLCTRNFCVMAPCQNYRQVSKQKNRGSPHRPREGNRRMGKEMGKETPLTQITLPKLETSKINYNFTQSILTLPRQENKVGQNDMIAIFVTEREAREFIASNYGKDAIIRNSSVSDRTGFDIDEVPYQWSGKTSAFEVNNGEAYVGYLEGENTFTIEFAGLSETTDSLYSAREIANEMKDIAEDLNVSGNIILSSEIYGEMDSIEVERYFDDEPEGTPEDFAKVWNRLKIGKVIRKARNRKCMSIRELAKATGLSKNNIERIESGLYNYTIDNLKTILSALDLTIEI